MFEALAYLVGFQWYLHRKRALGDNISGYDRWWIVAAAAAGAALGSKLLQLLGDPVALWSHRTDPVYLLTGKTIVGGLLGGWIAVEGTKKRLGVTKSTGDLFAPPLALGLAIGRVGCFLTGLPDNTHGLATALPTGVDFGDGILRHPTQLYEIAFLLFLIPLLFRIENAAHRPGDVFKMFMIAYLGFRLLVEFLKPVETHLGLSTIQWACALALAYYSRNLPQALERSRGVSDAR